MRLILNFFMQLEVNLQSELNIAWSVCLTSDFAKARRIVDVRARSTKSRAIEDVEKLRPELHVKSLADLLYVRPLHHGQVLIQEGKCPHIRFGTAHVSEGKWQRLRKG